MLLLSVSSVCFALCLYFTLFLLCFFTPFSSAICSCNTRMYFAPVLRVCILLLVLDCILVLFSSVFYSCSRLYLLLLKACSRLYFLPQSLAVRFVYQCVCLCVCLSIQWPPCPMFPCVNCCLSVGSSVTWRVWGRRGSAAPSTGRSAVTLGITCFVEVRTRQAPPLRPLRPLQVRVWTLGLETRLSACPFCMELVPASPLRLPCKTVISWFLVPLLSFFFACLFGWFCFFFGCLVFADCFQR